MKHLRGRRALVTGAASGIGRAIALRLASEGMDLLLVDRDATGLERVAFEAAPTGVAVERRVVDLARPGATAPLVDEAMDRWGGVDVLVNNAGLTYHGFLHLMPLEACERILAVNLTAAVMLTRGLLPGLLARGDGHVLNVCSVLGLAGMPRVALYCTSKFGLVGFTESLRAEYGRWGLGATALCPGFANTNLFSSAAPDSTGAPAKAPPARLMVSPEKVADRGVRAIQKNQRRVVLGPYARTLQLSRTLFPSPVDWFLQLGRRRRQRRHLRDLERLSPDRVTAIKMHLARQAEVEAPRRAA